MSRSFQRSRPLGLKPDSAHVFRAAYGGSDAGSEDTGEQDEALLRTG